MSLFVLDTDILSLFRGNHPVVSMRVSAQPPSDVAITVITVEEQLTGWYTLLRRSKRHDQGARAYQHLADTTSFLGGLNILAFAVSVLLAWAQVFLSQYCIGLLGFWVTHSMAVNDWLFVMRSLLSGNLAPLDLFPEPIPTLSPYPYRALKPSGSGGGGISAASVGGGTPLDFGASALGLAAGNSNGNTS